MKKIIILLLFLAIFFPRDLLAASAAHLNGLFTWEADQSMVAVSLEFDSQENDFPLQDERNVELDDIGDTRIHTQSRSSVNSFTYTGLKAGFKFKNLPFIYVTAGYADAEVDFTFKDTNTDNKNTYSLTTTFDTDTFAVFGGGITVQPLRKTIGENYTLHLGLDLSYRYIDFDTKKKAGSEETESYYMTYESTLHEVQLALVGAVDGFAFEPVTGVTVSLTPYLGCKISHFFSDERFTDTGNVSSSLGLENDPIIYEGDFEDSNHISFIAGAGIEITRNWVITLEVRTGDEDGYAGNILFRF